MENDTQNIFLSLWLYAVISRKQEKQYFNGFAITSKNFFLKRGYFFPAFWTFSTFICWLLIKFEIV